jgi:hypothetical protein
MLQDQNDIQKQASDDYAHVQQLAMLAIAMDESASGFLGEGLQVLIYKVNAKKNKDIRQLAKDPHFKDMLQITTKRMKPEDTIQSAYTKQMNCVIRQSFINVQEHAHKEKWQSADQAELP